MNTGFKETNITSHKELFQPERAFTLNNLRIFLSVDSEKYVIYSVSFRLVYSVG